MRPALAVLLAAACGGHPEQPRPVPAPRPVDRDPDLVRMPDDVWAVAAVDLTQLRDSTARRWVWEVLAERSPVVHRCRDELAGGTRVTLGLRERDRDRYSSSTFAIVHGIDRAAVTACLHRARADLPELPATQAPCDGFDAAVHALAICGQLPASQAAGLHALTDRLAGEGAAACPVAARAVEAANARRVELGWECRLEEHRDRIRARTEAAAADIDRDTVALGDYERIRFVDDHTIEIGAAEAVNGAEDAEATAKVLGELRPSAKARWFEASAQTIDRTRGAWIVADLHALIKEPIAAAGSINLRGDVAIDLQLANAPAKLTNEAISIAERALADPMFAGIHAELGCSPVVTPPRTPKYLACEAAQDHLQMLETSRNVDPKGLLDERALRCVEDNWPADYVACIAAMATAADWDRCYQQLSASDRERVQGSQSSACGTRAFHVHVTVPDARIEALKLLGVLDLSPKRDCRVPSQGAPANLAIGKGLDGRPTARFCLRGEPPEGMPPDAAPQDCSLMAIDAPPGPADARWNDGYELAFDRERCVGPLVFAPELATSNGDCTHVQPDDVPAFEQRPVFAIRPNGPNGFSVCRKGSPCLSTPWFDALAIASDGKLVAVHAGKAIETWDALRGTRIARFPVDAACTQVSIAGELVAVACGAKSYLATRTGARVAPLGDVVFAPLRLAGNQWGFVSRTGDRLVAYDGASGAERSRVTLPHAVEAGMVGAIGDGDGRVVVVYGGSGPDAGAVVVVGPEGVMDLRQTACPTPTPAGH